MNHDTWLLEQGRREKSLLCLNNSALEIVKAFDRQRPNDHPLMEHLDLSTRVSTKLLCEASGLSVSKLLEYDDFDDVVQHIRERGGEPTDEIRGVMKKAWEKLKGTKLGRMAQGVGDIGFTGKGTTMLAGEETFDIEKITEVQTDFGWITIVTRPGDPRPILIQPATVGASKSAWPQFNDLLWSEFRKYSDYGRQIMGEVREHLIKAGMTEAALHVPEHLSNYKANKWMRDAFLYVDHGYCLTIHKSQGSEWDEVGCLLGSWILNNRDQKFSRQAQYTAVTRTRNKLLVWA